MIIEKLKYKFFQGTFTTKQAERIGISNGLWKPVGGPTGAWVADRCRPGRLGTGICTVVLS